MLSNIEENAYFIRFYKKISQRITNEQLKEFSQLDTNEKQFQYIQNLQFVKELLMEDALMMMDKVKLPSQKNANVALELKRLGNLEFGKNKWLDAIIYYNRSVMEMPGENETDMAIILANRAAAFYHLKCCDLAIDDIDLITGSYPMDMLYKIKERKARCLLENKDLAAALDAFKETITALDTAKLPVDKRGKIEKDCLVMVKLLTAQLVADANPKQSKTKKHQDKLKQNITQPSNVDNLFELNVSKKLAFDSNEIDGRYAKANANINVGDKILAERPHCSQLLHDKCLTHCQNCFIRPRAPLPCPNCKNVIFCSKKCRDIGMKTYHKIECGILSILWRSEVSINCHLALRIITQKSMDYFRGIKDDLIDGDCGGGDLEKMQRYEFDDYRRIFNLVRHEHLRKPKDMLQYTIMAYFLMECLKLGNFFTDDDCQLETTTINENDNELNENFIGGLILRNLQFLQYNLHEISELVNLGKMKQTTKTVFIGAGLYPTLALFNHSCNPTVTRFYSGNKVGVHAITNLECGDELTENYGPLYAHQSKVERQLQLKQLYNFDCMCEACQDDWPLYDNMKTDELRFRCNGTASCKGVVIFPINSNDFMVICTSCGKFTNIMKGLKSMQDTDILLKGANLAMASGDFKLAFDKHCEIYTIMKNVTVPPYQDYCKTQQNIKDCISNFGTVYFTD